MKISEQRVEYLDHMGSDRICKGCLLSLSNSEFPVRKDRSGRLRPYCFSCSATIARVRYENHRRESPFKHKATRARSRAQSLGVPYDLDAEYLESIWTGICPVLSVPISLVEKDRSDEFTAELDRFIPSKGYIKGNVCFLSRRANRLKNNVSSKELKQLLNWMEEIENR